MPKISIIIPVYNTEIYIKQCLDSVLKQTYKDFEIIIINDGSTDNSELVITETVKNYNNLKYLYQENRGLSESRNLGIKHARGEYISFIDSDDWIEESFLEQMVTAVEKNGADLGQCGYFRKDGSNIAGFTMPKSKTVYSLNEESTYISYYYNTFIQHKYGIICCNKLYKKEIIDKEGLKFQKNSEIYAEDLLFNIEYLVNSNKIIDVPICLYNYRVREGSITQTNKPFLEKRYAELMKRVEKLINERLTIYNKEFMAIAHYETLNVISINAFSKIKSQKSILNSIKEYNKYNKEYSSNLRNLLRALIITKNISEMKLKVFLFVLFLSTYVNSDYLTSYLYYTKVKIMRTFYDK